jgi:predicted transcriptional regulator
VSKLLEHPWLAKVCKDSLLAAMVAEFLEAKKATEKEIEAGDVEAVTA